MNASLDLELQVAVAKVSKYAVSESGDTVETIERPHGGLSLVVVDGQRSGKSAKAISNIVARKAVSLIADGVRDGAVARAAHDYLRTLRSGQVSATLDIVSVDLVTRTIVVSRNSHCPVIVVDSSGVRLLDEPSEPIGIHARTRPVITELPLAPDTHLVVLTDGALTAGQQWGECLDVPAFVADRLQARPQGADPLHSDPPAPRGRDSLQSTPCGRDASQSGRCYAPALAEALLARAVELERGRPIDDISVVVLSVVAGRDPGGVRRLFIRFPI